MESRSASEQYNEENWENDSGSTQSEDGSSSNESIFKYLHGEVKKKFNDLGKYKDSEKFSTMLETRSFFIFENFDMYEGQWNIAANKPEGQGVMIRARDHKLFEGYFAEGKLNGHGRSINELGDLYVGQWKDNKKHDKGVFTWGLETEWAGHTYEGEYQNGIKCGYGAYTWPDGKKYEG